mmetsp:Transcript_1913/g.3059  ORF Transcript_1913/g.3059 Transcript_1913/m.3059 type:complete len:205 (+) Transcript_1913:244-858(+)|eukprot:CAMPEP_0184328378 /NCGR_PEP_ID=MMETSP1049-20130417/143590_1 /TAXON_ID=77928 /ORGANISM="Proteomonas sulcata, Strain CCMP704" /LENGTH=204 /DNA_ID=CAMNT_0026650685 /DNA_START=201 /DNA_END=815 /DNA_ORIENTATION=+
MEAAQKTTDASDFLLHLQTWQDVNPRTAEVVSAVILCMLADLIAQAISKYREGKEASWLKWDLLSLMRMGSWSTLCTPVIGHWLVFLDTTFGSGNDWSTVLQKLACDQICFGPVMMSSFFLYMGIFNWLTVRGYEFSETIYILRYELFGAWLGSLYFWTPVSISIFTIVPDHAKILVLNIAGLIYNVGLCLTISGTETKSSKLE